jgi:hypothetical protein
MCTHFLEPKSVVCSTKFHEDVSCQGLTDLTAPLINSFVTKVVKPKQNVKLVMIPLGITIIGVTNVHIDPICESSFQLTFSGV